MREFGFSTGALAFGDFRKAMSMLEQFDCSTVELSALREAELPTLMLALEELDLARFNYVSVHAPSRLHDMTEREVAGYLRPCIDRQWPVILHPDTIEDHGVWREFGQLLCLENMDKRKATGRTAGELEPHFEKLPEASMCLDLGHARQVDPTFGVGRRLLRDFGDRVTQLHLSELDAKSHHSPLSMTSVWAIREIAHLIPPVPVILESVVNPDKISKEFITARKCFETQRQYVESNTTTDSLTR